MGIDRPDDDDFPVAVGTDKIIADETDASDDNRKYEYHLEYRDTVDAVYLAAARERWVAAKPEFEEEWRLYTAEHPAPPDVRPDIDEEIRAQVEQGCKEIRETEENVITPAMIRIEAEDPERMLVGLEFSCKGQDRLIEKVIHDVQYKGRTPEEALANMKDAIRYTFQYTEARYTAGVDADVRRLKAAGFELVELRNSWASDEYKGINSRWRVPGKGQLFEVQFHTRSSFEAKQLTHPAYELLRNPATSKVEQDELVDFERRVTACMAVPRGARDYPDYP